MRRVGVAAWLLVPVAASAYHFGPGQLRMDLDRVADRVSAAEQHAHRAEALAADSQDEAARVEWAEALQEYEAALKGLPADRVEDARRLRVEMAKARMFVHQLPAAHMELEALVDEIAADPAPDPKLLEDAREALAGSQYYMTWLMRLEGATREEWEPKVDAARQNYRLLAEESRADGDAGLAQKHERSLESAIRLARMDLNELQGLPIPSQ